MLWNLFNACLVWDLDSSKPQILFYLFLNIFVHIAWSLLFSINILNIFCLNAHFPSINSYDLLFYFFKSLLFPLKKQKNLEIYCCLMWMSLLIKIYYC